MVDDPEVRRVLSQLEPIIRDIQARITEISHEKLNSSNYSHKDASYNLTTLIPMNIWMNEVLPE